MAMPMRNPKVLQQHQRLMRTSAIKVHEMCCNLSVGGALNVWFTTNGMCVKNNTTCVERTSSNRVIAVHDLYCCLLPQCKALRTCRSGFPITTDKAKAEVTSSVHDQKTCLSTMMVKTIVDPDKLKGAIAGMVQLIWLRGHFKKAAFSGGPYLWK